jgi:asparagine synthase (glutamine-hydrolysing)
VFWSGAEAFTDIEKQRLLSPRLQKRFAGVTSWDAVSSEWNDFQQNAWDKSPLHWMTHADLRLRLPELLLMRVDKMSMAVSLEGRVPFLDHKFVELVLGLPTSLKTRNGQLKYILKKAVRGLLPDEIIDRKKQGFAIPLHEWFLDGIGRYAEQELTAFCRETDFFDLPVVLRYVRERRPKQVWYLLNFALWWNSYIAGKNLEAAPEASVAAALA